MGSAIRLDGVSKSFLIGSDRPASLKERIVRGRRSTSGSAPFWALRDVDLAIETWQTVGLLGHNGSGKSTLLKVVGGILSPTKGTVERHGRIASLLELGAGFHPDLTGRENVFLNGAILGLSQQELRSRFDAIVEFAEIEQFIDTPVRSYSSGMYMRLGFAVAVNVDPDILLIDEVLSVGDETFQRKCLDRVRQFQKDGRTIVVVTHSADLLRQIADSVAVLDGGRLVAYGPPGEAIRSFREHLLERQLDRQAVVDERHAQEIPESAATDAGGASVGTRQTATEARGSTQEGNRDLAVRIDSIELLHDRLAERSYLLPGEGLTIAVHYTCRERIDDVTIGLSIVNLADGKELFGTNTEYLDAPLAYLEGSGTVCFDLAAVPLLDGTFAVTVGIVSRDFGRVYDWSEQRHRFEVMNPSRSVGVVALPVTVSQPADR